MAVKESVSKVVQGGFYDHNGRWIPEYVESTPVHNSAEQESTPDRETGYARMVIREQLAMLDTALRDPQQYHFRTKARDASTELRAVAANLLGSNPSLSLELTNAALALWVSDKPQSDVARTDRDKVKQATEILRNL